MFSGMIQIASLLLTLLYNQSKVVSTPQFFYLIMALLSYMIFQWSQVDCQHMKNKFFSSFLQNVNNCNKSQGLHISCCCLNGNGR